MAHESVTLKKPRTKTVEPVESSHYSDPALRIEFCHPAYDPPHDILLTLFGFDYLGGGIHHNTALVACAIVAGNQWCGYFTETRDGPSVTAACDEILRGKKYYFHVIDPQNGGDELTSHPIYKYPIIPLFREWVFPHDNLPRGWDDISGLKLSAVPSTRRTNPAASTESHKQPCRLSYDRDCTSSAHLCPRSESDWFAGNRMGRYGLDPEVKGIHAVNDVRNILSLRYDLHQDFDNRKFVFVPKKSKSAPETVIVAHMLKPTHELGLLYHNFQLHPTPNISPEFLLARFAWTIFPSLRTFLECGVPRWLLRTETVGNQKASRAVETSAVTCHYLASVPETRSKKRQRASDSSIDRWDRSIVIIYQEDIVDR
ncbi:hypothetical protein GP486_006032 [Trichoglossum hirsutum]|uniref:HNH nuclease domain-containing protein n=1 Tax=Trichoglossum hirsutum TaxID=265104 RepID=A0A9P8L850_9PEZI|nr:hypothetical protein GP486_006032 [Trichoglossum hirsutum]